METLPSLCKTPLQKREESTGEWVKCRNLRQTNTQGLFLDLLMTYVKQGTALQPNADV